MPESVPQRPSLGVWLRRLVLTGVAGMAVLASAELGARADDWLFNGVPLLSNPRYEDLLVSDGRTLRGRPHGQFGKWRLNAEGFRGPELVEARPRCCPRVVILGASEAFGYLESPDREFPAAVRAELARRGECAEIINAALAGMTVRSMSGYWEYWVASFRPDIVIIYPSTHLYLGHLGELPAADAPPPQAVPLTPIVNHWNSRYLDRLRNVIDTPEFIAKWRREKKLQSLIAASAADGPVFAAVPDERLDMLGADLSRLAERIRHAGAQPVIMTHAMRAESPARAADFADLNAMRQFLPRAPEPVIAAFDAAANQRIRELGPALGVPVIDIAHAVGGQRELFGDLVHFTDEGARRVGTEVAGALATINRQRPACSQTN